MHSKRRCQHSDQFPLGCNVDPVCDRIDEAGGSIGNIVTDQPIDEGADFARRLTVTTVQAHGRLPLPPNGGQGCRRRPEKIRAIGLLAC